jgi:preprotein translocase subunit SecG
VLTRATAILAAVFFTTSLVLSMLAGIDRKPRSVLTPGGQPSPGAPVSPGAPLGGPGGGVLDQLRGPPAQPAPPAAPQVPRSQ